MNKDVDSTLKFREWEFEVDKLLTKQTYEKTFAGGSDTCICNDCKNYVSFRDNVFPEEVQNLFHDLGIDYRKEVEITTYEVLPNGLHHIGGWFHFKGKIIKGKDCRVPLPNSGFTFDLTKITDNFELGFTNGNDLAFFENTDHIVQIEFMTNIPWVIDKSLETK